MIRDKEEQPDITLLLAMTCIKNFYLLQDYIKQTCKAGFAERFDRVLHWTLCNPAQQGAYRLSWIHTKRGRSSLLVPHLVDLAMVTMGSSSNVTVQAGHWLEIIANKIKLIRLFLLRISFIFHWRHFDHEPSFSGMCFHLKLTRPVLVLYHCLVVFLVCF